jgi:hypothetical protein
MVCLSIAGVFVAGMHYFVIDLPQQNAAQAPENSVDNPDMACMTICQDAFSHCMDLYYSCIGPNCGSFYDECLVEVDACMIPCDLDS